MFEAAEVGRKLAKSDYKAQVPLLRSELLSVQQELRQASFPVIVLFAGVDTAGKGETVNLLNEWMDPRWIVTRGYTSPSSEERERPRLWRYWRDLPPHGRLAMFLSALVLLADPRSCGGPSQHRGVRLPARPDRHIRACTDRRWRGCREVLDALE